MSDKSVKKIAVAIICAALIFKECWITALIAVLVLW